jgi:hypothetical protein
MSKPEREFLLFRMGATFRIVALLEGYPNADTAEYGTHNQRRLLFGNPQPEIPTTASVITL